MDAFTRAFFECALWSSTDNSTESGGEPLDANYTIDDIAPDALAALTAECEAFQRDNAALLEAGWQTDSQAGYDFWLTRNGHGAGFWDGDWDEQGDALTAASKSYRPVDLYVGDDGVIYAYGYETAAAK